jgi:hypothetical protein
LRQNPICRTNWLITSRSYRRERQRIAKEREEIELDTLKRKASNDWMLTAVHLNTIDATATVARNSVLQTIEIQTKNAVESVVKEVITDPASQQVLIEKLRPIYPAMFEQWQKDLSARLDQLIAEADFENAKRKSEL